MYPAIYKITVYLPSVSIMVIIAELTTISSIVQLDAIMNESNWKRSMPSRVIRNGIERSTINCSLPSSATPSAMT